MAVYHNDCLKELLEPLGLEIRRDLVFMHVSSKVTEWIVFNVDVACCAY